MKTTESPKQSPQTPATKRPLCPDERVAFTPREFAALFGRSTTWGYRRIYDGSVKTIRVLGLQMIPRGEVDRLLADTVTYDGKKPKLHQQRNHLD